MATAGMAIDVASPDKKVLDKEDGKKSPAAEKSGKLLMSLGVK